MNKKEEIRKKKEHEWIGIGLGSGKFGEEELKKDIKKKREAKSIFNKAPAKKEELKKDIKKKREAKSIFNKAPAKKEELKKDIK
eukprot:CAMPEP_0205802642 /NCGR_PEP_ID=MMETSP0205-20121125/5036_1 /ASSEMBLY_ACC=CAM_ASM_000278 /TAXON_ID=36767 /ORGANISM="Euplotes focardii, Strain TN1" /LENGTH=83 /DNA_ID=CAMNT_0053069405 /DNA_START=203 /DNA_END=451 /DNA_ORIENTATION=-